MNDHEPFPDDLTRALQRLNQELDEVPAPPRFRPISRQASRLRTSRPPWRLAGVGILAVALTTIVVMVGFRDAEPPGIETIAASPEFAWEQHGEAWEVEQGWVELELPEHRLTVKLESKTRWRPAAAPETRSDEPVATVARGRARFDVDPRRAGESPVRIGVRGGTIEVLGTRFVIEQDDRGGRVDVSKGRVRFVESSSERRVVIAAGQSLSWSHSTSSESVDLRPTMGGTSLGDAGSLTGDSEPVEPQGEAEPSDASFRNTEEVESVTPRSSDRPLRKKVRVTPGREQAPSGREATALRRDPEVSDPTETPSAPDEQAVPGFVLKDALRSLAALRLRQDHAGLEAKLQELVETVDEPEYAAPFIYELAELRGLKLDRAEQGCALLRSKREVLITGGYATLAQRLRRELSCPRL